MSDEVTVSARTGTIQRARNLFIIMLSVTFLLRHRSWSLKPKRFHLRIVIRCLIRVCSESGLFFCPCLSYIFRARPRMVLLTDLGAGLKNLFLARPSLQAQYYQRPRTRPY